MTYYRANLIKIRLNDSFLGIAFKLQLLDDVVLIFGVDNFLTLSSDGDVIVV